MFFCVFCVLPLRDWSLITGRGGCKTGGRTSQVLPLQKGGGGGKRFSHAQGGGGTTSFEVVLTQELEVLATVTGGGGAQKVSTL